MIHQIRIPVLALACAVAIAAPAQAAQPAHRHAATSAAAADARVRRWPTDAPLREGMARVRGALEELRHHEMGHMSAVAARGHAATIEQAVSYMFANCKLDADADAALHGILLPLLAAAQRLDKDPHDVSAIAAMRAAVAGYPQRFDDPQWRPGIDAAASIQGAH